MAFTGKEDSLLRNHGGGHNDGVDRGVAQFDGTALTMELPVRLSRIRPGSSVTIVPGTAGPTSVEYAFIQEAVNDKGEIIVPDTGEITIARKVEGGGTAQSNAHVFFHLVGATGEF